MPMNRSGIIVMDKPAGWSSFKLVQVARKSLGVKRAGHTGTLDPFATGVLPVCINEATKAIPFLSEDEKEYQGVMVLGITTDTFDLTGRITATAEVPPLTRDQMETVLADFTGFIRQVPPPFAAVKFKGKPSYYWARKGIYIEKEAREVAIQELTLEGFTPPEVSFRVVCSRGTYIRTLVNDIGRRIGCGAHLKVLRRLRSGPFTLKQALAPEVITERHLLTVSDILSYLPAVKVDELMAKRVQQGQELSLKEDEFSAACKSIGRPWVRVISASGRLLAIYTWRDGSRNLKALRVFNGL